MRKNRKRFSQVVSYRFVISKTNSTLANSKWKITKKVLQRLPKLKGPT